MENHLIVSVAEVKNWCRIDSAGDDQAVELLIRSAQEQAALFTGRVLLPETCPAGIRQAIAVFVADLYANREGQTVGDATFRRLLNPYRVGDL